MFKVDWKVLHITWDGKQNIQHYVCIGCSHNCRAVLPINEDPPPICILSLGEQQ